ncbi:hypothetical protein [Hyalangium minutum]|uniref:Lipase-like protein n=1 Tax=Hyalangium minutum TaxID=394096 RepID=A0A085W428_9BACT|nr:hypothetical protein [Hyalangium minutum]KFE62441.1 Lipase-like protein [Hyalangium minutum]
MKKLLLVGALTLGAASCAPDIKQDEAPDVVLADFNPAGSPVVVPTPNDLAIDSTTGLVNAPIDPSAPAAQQEFTRDYLNTLNGFPTSVTAFTKIADLDKTTVNTNSVRFIDLLAGTAIATPAVTPTIAYDEDTDQLIVAPPPSGWPKGGRYAIALVGGANGLKGVGGKQVVGSSVWSLASLEKSLVTCEDLTASNCLASTDLIPSTKTDPSERIKDQAATALRLEQLRRSYKPLLDALVAQGVNRSDIVLLWTFRIMNMPEATFDPAASIIPFPNNILLARNADGTTHLNLPIPPTAPQSQKDLLNGLNTLDGFSTTAPIVSENSDTRGPIDTGSRLDASSVAAGTKFIKLGTGGTAPSVTACLNCASSKNADGSTPNNAQQLQFVPQLPLDEKSTYAAVMTTALKDERGRQVAPSGPFALMRLSSPLVVDGKSQVSGVSDANAAALEPLRAGFKSMFDVLAQAGIPRSKISLAWAFTTQSTVSTLQKLYALPTQYGAAGLPNAPLYLLDVTTQVKAQMGALPKDHIGKIFQGTAIVPFVLTDPRGVFDPTKPKFERATFLLALPSTAAPANGYPVTIFSHGLRSHKGTVLPLFDALATGGHATIAMDTVFHGDRSTCAGITAAAGLVDGSNNPIDTPDKACNTGSTCDVTPTSPTFGRCMPVAPTTCNPTVATGEGICAAAALGHCVPTSTTDPTVGACEGGFKSNSGTPYISGWNMLNLTNLFATRDNFRQHTVEHAQLERVLTATSTTSLNAQLEAQSAGKLDGTKIHYVGQSLGGILGPLYTSASPVVKNAVFNVPAGDLTGVLFNSPAFAQAKAGFIAALGAQGLTPGTPGFDQFLVLGKTILDPADPINYVYAVENGPASPATGREALIQYIEKDQVSPNAQTEALIAAANRTGAPKTVNVSKFTPTEAELPLDKRHAFLLDFQGNPTITGQAQGQVVQFLGTGALP